MIRRSTLIVLGVFVVALAALFLLQSMPNSPLSPASTPPATPQPNLVTGWKESDITVLVNNQATGNEIRLEKKSDGSWTTANGAKIDAGVAGQITSEILAIRVVNTLPLETTLASLKLDNPVQKIIIQGAGGKTATLSIGSVTPTQSGYYVKVDNNAPVIVNKDAVDTLLQLFEQAIAPTPTPTLDTTTPAAVTPTPTPTP